MNRNGMSMVEVMIGVLLLALILLPSLNVIIGKTQTVSTTRDHAQAALVAQKLQEICRSYSFNMIEADQYKSDNLNEEKTFEWKLLNTPELSQTTLNGITYKVVQENTSIDPLKNSLTDDDSYPSVYLFRLELKYKGKDGRDHFLNVSTAIAQRE